MKNNLQKALAQIPTLIELAESELATATNAKDIESLQWWIQYLQQQQNTESK